jgi:hypothetical protein
MFLLTWTLFAGGAGGTVQARPDITLSDVSGNLLGADVLAYPEDTYLVVDPYSAVDEPAASMPELIARAESTLPRPWGEIITARGTGVGATWLLRLVLLDFQGQRVCRAEVVEETLCRLVRQGARLKARRLVLDRFELLEPCISAYRVLSCLCRETARVRAADCQVLTTVIFALQQPPALRHYQMALANLRKDAG